MTVGAGGALSGGRERPAGGGGVLPNPTRFRERPHLARNDLAAAASRRLARRRRHEGFTLVEILVAVAIIAVLSAIATSVLLGARGSAKKTRCASNLAQIGKALHLYTVDHEGYVPPYSWFDTPKLVARRTEFIESLAPLGAKRELFYCPADPHKGKDFLGEWHDFKETSYVAGILFFASGRAGEGGSFILDLGAVKDPSKTTLFYDQPWLVGGGEDPQRAVCAHGDQANHLYADSHVESKPLTRR